MHFLERKHPSRNLTHTTHRRKPKFLSVVFLKPLADMIQASSGRFPRVLLKIQITEQFGAFEGAGVGTGSPGLLGQGLAGDKAEPGTRHWGNWLCLQIREASCSEHGINNF